MRKGNKLNDQELNNSDIAILTDIACLDPLLFGSGVYQARAIMNWDGFCKTTDNKSSTNYSIEVLKIDKKSIIYPNPSNGEFKIESIDMIDSINIYDLKGIEKTSYKIEEYQAEINLLVNNGVYIIKITFVDGSIELHKIHIH